jgi:hypothetical protein
LRRCSGTAPGDDPAVDALEDEIEGGIADAQATQRDLVDPQGKLRMVDADFPGPAVHLDPEAGLQDHEARTRRPRLREARDRVGHGRGALFAGETTEQLRQPHLEVRRRLEHRAQQAERAAAVVVRDA